MGIEENELLVEITPHDIKGRRISCLPQDEFRVLIFSTTSKVILGEKYELPGNVVLGYSIVLPKDDSFSNYMLIVTLPVEPLTVGNTPVILGDASPSDFELRGNWMHAWTPVADYSALVLVPSDKYIQSRNAYYAEVKQAIEDKKRAQDPSPAGMSERLTTEEYLQVCTDAIKLAKLAYIKESKEYVSKHIIQRILNRETFAYRPEHQQKLKVFYFSPPVSIAWYKSGKTCFFTFERGGDLYICIRGTKTAADIIADLKYSLVPYRPRGKANSPKAGRRKRFKNKIIGGEHEQEMIHNGFSVYADIIIQHFCDSYSELLSNREESRRLFICGHSLGGGIAQVIARKMVQEENWKGPIVVATFGSPLIGNKAFCNWNGWRSAENLKIFNFVNQKDPVTNLLVRSWSIFTKIGVAPKPAEFGYTATKIYAFSHTTSTLIVLDHQDVLPFLTQQVAWNPKDLMRFVVTHTGIVYHANMSKLYDDFFTNHIETFSVP